MISVDDLTKLTSQAISGIARANRVKLLNIQMQYLGKNGTLTHATKQLAHAPKEERKALGIKINEVKHTILAALKEREMALTRKEPAIDTTVPGTKHTVGHLHPITHIVEEAREIFASIGFVMVDGPEVELDSYNFQKLRLHKDHPARDTQDTYYIAQDVLLRTHTSPMQIRYMETHKPPLRAIFPGRVYRRDQIDATHLPGFFQLEGLLVDHKTSMSELIGVLHYFVQRLFGQDRKIRIYGHYFPYTEPSIEVEMRHSDGRWMEILGAGMVHPEVLTNCHIDPTEFRGWAFGMGPERLAMLKWEISDIRSFYSGDLRFLEQFS